MKKKTVYLSVILAVLVLFINSKTVYANIDINEFENVSDTYEDLLGYVENIYYIGFSEEDINYEIVDLSISKYSFKFELNGFVDFVDVIGTLTDGKYVNLSRVVDCIIKDVGIAEYDRGRIYAINKGTTEITLSYGNFIRVITVTVNGFKEMLTDINSLIESLTLMNNMNVRSVPQEQWVNVMKRAYDMMNVKWTPTQDFIPNNQNISYPSGVELKGVPYSQTGNQFQDKSFLASLNNADFYKPYYRPNDPTNRDPMYGVDCSGFVSFSYAIARQTTDGIYSDLKLASPIKFEKIGSYTLDSNVTTDISKDDLKNAYSGLYQSCALLMRKTLSNGNIGGHTRLVVTKYDNYVECIENANNFPEQIRYSFDQLASDSYVPYTVKSSYYNTSPY